jgi:hypothetical protein
MIPICFRPQAPVDGTDPIYSPEVFQRPPRLSERNPISKSNQRSVQTAWRHRLDRSAATRPTPQLRRRPRGAAVITNRLIAAV